ncbi:MAG: DUF3578 domain-containing protein [Pseudorhizobium pelagicum]|uniref:MrcB family domain-containing protein n=1 Tax=Pseudorhizobium pelagicum TaxID=1509405 RepID=UPI00345FA4CA
MSLRETLSQILSDYPTASSVSASVAAAVRGKLPEDVATSLGALGSSLIVKGSSGQTNLATVPWCGVLDPAVTSTAQSGYYVVYLFAADGSSVALSLNQGATALIRDFHGEKGAAGALRARAEDMRRRIDTRTRQRLQDQKLDLRATGKASLYEAGHAFGRVYRSAALPDEVDLVQDLREAVAVYLEFTRIGGFDPAEALDEQYTRERGDGGSVEEKRRYSLHRKLDRRANREMVRKAHGSAACQVCRLEFKEKYGPLGDGYFEAHHLTPLASLAPGEARRYDYKADFAVLCANCHRMAHRLKDPSQLDVLRKALKTTERA